MDFVDLVAPASPINPPSPAYSSSTTVLLSPRTCPSPSPSLASTLTLSPAACMRSSPLRASSPLPSSSQASTLVLDAHAKPPGSSPSSLASTLVLTVHGEAHATSPSSVASTVPQATPPASPPLCSRRLFNDTVMFHLTVVGFGRGRSSFSKRTVRQLQGRQVFVEVAPNAHTPLGYGQLLMSGYLSCVLTLFARCSDGAENHRSGLCRLRVRAPESLPAATAEKPVLASAPSCRTRLFGERTCNAYFDACYLFTNKS